jgi:hypothetical protein
MAEKPTVKPNYKHNILKVWNKSNPYEINSGVYWYDNARKVAEGIAQQFDIPLDRVCLVISALSPNNNWTRNISDAWKVCRAWYEKQDRATVSTSTYPANKLKAFDILDGKLDYLNGLKTANFARNIAGCQDSVTVDVHIYSVAHGKRFTAKTVGAIPPKVYADIVKAFQDVASKINITPSQLQAIVWQTWRRLYGLTTHAELTPRLF